MTDTRPPTDRLRYAADATRAGMDALRAFLEDRLRSQMAAHREDSPEHGTAAGMFRLARHIHIEAGA